MLSLVTCFPHRLEKEYTTIKNKEMEEQIEIKVSFHDMSEAAELIVRADAPHFHPILGITIYNCF